MGHLHIFSCILVISLGSVLACTDGDIEEIPGKCRLYKKCENDNFIVHSCSILHRFDPQKKKCTWLWNMNCKEISRPCTGNKKYSYRECCRKYIECSEEKLVIKSCPLLHTFDVKSQKCIWGLTCTKPECNEMESRPHPDCSKFEQCTDGKWEVKICQDSYYFTTKKYDPISEVCISGTCEQCTFGEKRKSSICKNYQECQGLWYEKECPIGHRYNPEKEQCVWFFNYHCPSKNDESSLLKPMLKLKDTSCKENEMKPLSCSSYNVCTKGKFEAKQCPEGEIFSKNGCTKEHCSIRAVDCKRYKINGIEMTCEEGHFDKNSMTCTNEGVCEENETRKIIIE